jgi:hypothetical protein
MVLVAALVAGTASAALAAGGTVGDPQPELALFNVGTAGGGRGSGAVLPDGTLVLASSPKSGTTAVVCMLHPGDRQCASTATLSAHNADSFYGVTQVLATGGTDVSVVLRDCCNIGNNTLVVFDSTNDGKTFSPEIQAGNLSGIDTGTVADGQIVVAQHGGGGTQVQAFSLPVNTPQTAIAQLNTHTAVDASVSTYNGGVLVASDNLTNSYVLFAPRGSNFNDSSSYSPAGTFQKEDVTALSGNALLTNPGGSLTGGERLRFFNGTSFGAAHTVPEPQGRDDGYFNLQEVGGAVHVFFLNRRHSYDIYSETTRDGVHWSSRAIYNTAITSDSLMPVLGPRGAGLLYETDSKPLLAQPILLPQSVHITLAHARVKVGTKTKLTGTASPHLVGQTVTLERLSAGRWHNVSATHESSSGTFSFTVPGATETYRTVVAFNPGYYLYGYSNRVTLTAVPKK